MNEELKKAIYRLKEDLNECKNDTTTLVFTEDLETVLNYIDNSIPKEVIEKKIEELKLGQETTNKSSWCNIYQYQILILQEVLEGK